MTGRLKAEDRALDPSRVLRLLRETCAEDSPHIARIIATETIAHRPGRRLTLRFSVEVRREGRPPEPGSMFGKAYRGHGGERVYRLLKPLRAALPPNLRVPRPLGYHGRRRFLLLEPLPGIPLPQLLSQPASPALVFAFGFALADFHVARPRSDDGAPGEFLFVSREHGAEQEKRVLDRAAQVIVSSPFPQEIRSRFHAAREQAVELLTGPKPPPATFRLLHRDLHPKQVRVDGHVFGLLDLDEVSWGEPELDAGNFVAHLLLHDLQTRSTIGPALREADGFCAGYGARRPFVKERLRAYTAGSLLRLASLERVSRPDVSILAWAELASALIHEAEKTLDLPRLFRTA